MMSGRFVARAAAVVAFVLGVGSAAISAWWAVGGTALLDTVGGEIERWGRQRSPEVVGALWLIAVLKAGVGAAAPVLVWRPAHLPAWTFGMVPRALGWIATIVLTIYGGVLTAVGLLVQVGIITASADSDPRALAWHAYLWDPWFLCWGAAFGVGLWLTRHRS